MSGSIYAALELRYPAPEYALFYEVANGPGSTLRRYADAMVMSLFPSRGLDLNGFEIKTARSDWLNEKKKPEKAEEIAKYCDFWWLVTETTEVAKLEEIPKNWGWLALVNGKLRVKKQAERLEPQQISRKFLAALLRRCHEQIKSKRQKIQAVETAYQKGLKEGLDRGKHHAGYEAEDHKRLKESVEKFEKDSGIKIHSWGWGQQGRAVKALENLLDSDSPSSDMRHLAQKLTGLAQELERDSVSIDESLVALRKVAKGKVNA